MFTSPKRTIECVGAPGSGKTTAATRVAHERGLKLIPSYPPRGYCVWCAARYPLFVLVWIFALVLECARSGTWGLFRFKLSVFLNTCARTMYARHHGGVLDEGCVQRLLSLYERNVSEQTFSHWLRVTPVLQNVLFVRRAQTKVSPVRGGLGEDHIYAWKGVIAHNCETLYNALKRRKITIELI